MSADHETISGTPPPSHPPLVIERDDGQFQIGLDDDAAGPFETRTFASAVAQQLVGHPA